jgi:hypothetical protein
MQHCKEIEAKAFEVSRSAHAVKHYFADFQFPALMAAYT